MNDNWKFLINHLDKYINSTAYKVDIIIKFINFFEWFEQIISFNEKK